MAGGYTVVQCGPLLDPNGNVYTSAKVEANLDQSAIGSGTGPVLLGGTSVFQTQVTGETDSFGNLTLTLADVNQITPSGCVWDFSVINSTGLIGFTLQNQVITGNTQNIAAAMQAAAAPLAVPTGFGNITVTGLTDTGPALIGGNLTATAGQNQIKAFSLNSELSLDNNKYVFSGAGIIAASADLPSTGGVIHVPPNANPTFAASWTITKPIVLKVASPNTLTLAANQIIVSAGVDGVAIIGEGAPYGGSGSNFQHNAISITYTGSSAAIQVGLNGATDTHSFSLCGVQVDISGATGTAIGLKYTQVTKSIVACCQFSMNVSGQIGVQTNGGTTFTGTNTWHANYFQSGGGVNVTGMQFGGDGNQSNADVLSGENHFTLGGPATTSVGIDKKAGDTLILVEASVDNALYALTVESTAAVAVWGFLRIDSSTTNVVNYGAGSQGNKIWVNGNKPFVDNGVAGTNSVENPARNSFRTDVWQNQVQATFSFFYKDLLDSGANRLTLVNGAAGDTRLNSGSGAGLIKLAWEQGTGGVSFGNGANVGVSQVDSTGVFKPVVAGAIDLGSAALPFSGVRIGAAATNNIRVTGTATAARTQTLQDVTGTLGVVIASGTSTLTVNAALAAVTSQAAITTAATGALTTDAIEWSYASAPGAGDSLCVLSPYVTAANVNFVRTNPTAGAQSVSAIVINWRVIR